MKTVIIPAFVCLLFSMQLRAQPSLKYEENQTLTWKESIGFYEYLADNFDYCTLEIAGETDAGKPLHLFIISKDKLFDPVKAKEAGRAVMLINNGIHPGEPCGVDASAKFAMEVLQNQQLYTEVLDNVVICIVPILNVGGALNRGEFNRTNQNGPLEHGFRANAINNDLNRDFIKLDTRNARSFVGIMREWDPDILVDTHTSNGSDYQYVLTLIATQRDKLNAPLNDYLYNHMLPELYSGMETTPYEMTPYVESFNGKDPKSGIVGFMDYPRYTTGYAALFNTIGFTLETHMFKPYRDRVLSCFHFLKISSSYLAENKSDILKLRAATKETLRQKREYTMEWTLDTSQYDEILFKGYEIKYRTSGISGKQTYYFDRNSPWEEKIRNYTYYQPGKTISSPEFYIVPSAWREVLERFQLNEVEMYPIHKDTALEVEYYYIDDFKTTSNAYNGHYFHSNTTVTKLQGKLNFLAGDMFIPVNQSANEFIVQVLEPEAMDSYFNWNFFDPILSRKEYFSPYIFDEMAVKIIEDDPVLKKDFEQKKEEDSDFANDHYAQLRYIYEHSVYSEKTFMRYPVARYYLNK